MYSHQLGADPEAACATQDVLNRMRACDRFARCSEATQSSHLRWTQEFLQWHRRHGNGRQPHDWGADEVNTYLATLAERSRTTAVMHRQALHALLFLFRHVLRRDLLRASSSPR